MTQITITDSQKHNIQEAKLYQGAGRDASAGESAVKEERQADPGSLQTNQPAKMLSVGFSGRLK